LEIRNEVRKILEELTINFTHQELAILNSMVGIAFRTGKIEFNEITESIHKKIAEELIRKAEPESNKYNL